MSIKIQSQNHSDIYLGHAGIDTEHQIQVELMIALEDSLKQQHDMLKTNEVLNYLVAYTDAHFNSERLLMRLHAYPHYEAHEEEHSYYLEQLQTMRQKLQTGEIKFTIELLNKLRHWLIEHIRTTDRAFGQYLAATA